MKLFSIYFSTLTFLLIELIGLIKGEPVGSILLKSVGSFVVLFFLGDALAKYFGPIKAKEEPTVDQEVSVGGSNVNTSKDAVSTPTLVQGPVTTDSQTEMYKQEAIRLAREKPKEVAQIFETLINK